MTGNARETPTQAGAQLEPWEIADHWQSLAIAAAIITLICGGFALLWVFDARTDRAMLTRVQIVGGGMAVGLAIVTFCTVLWRGLISQQQAIAQQVQIEHLTRQIAETNRTNLAEFLQNGAEMISDVAQPAKVLAGIATLQDVASDESKRFSVFAMNLLANFVQTYGRTSHQSPLVGAAIVALNAAAEAGAVLSTIRASFSADKETNPRWLLIDGISSVTYEGGTVIGETIKRARSFRPPFKIFDNVVFYNCTVENESFSGMSNCSFYYCKIKAISVISLRSNKYWRCDFSGAQIYALDGTDELPDLREDENAYSEEDLPELYGSKNSSWTPTDHFLELSAKEMSSRSLQALFLNPDDF